MFDFSPAEANLPAYTGVFVFGDSVVDAGNALRAAQFLASLPFATLPERAPIASNGYFEGRFSDGYTFADLVSNKMLSVPTQPTFPFGFKDPVFGIELSSVRPPGANLNFAYGGAQAVRGDEVVPDLGEQVDAYRNQAAADPNALHVITMGGNDVRELVPQSGAPVIGAAATDALAAAAAEIRNEVGQLYASGARHVLLIGVPDIGLLPNYNGSDGEAGRRSLAGAYSRQLDSLIRSETGALSLPPGAELRAFSLIDYSNRLLADPQAYRLTNLTQARTTVQAGHLDPVGSGFLFFDDVHPSAQVHALVAGAILDSLRDSGAVGDVGPAQGLAAVSASIDAPGASEAFSVSLVAGQSYSLEVLGLSSGSGSLDDPVVRLVDGLGRQVAADDDRGLGLDARLEFVGPATADYALWVGGVGVAAGSYVLHARDGSGADLALTGALRGSDEVLSGGASADTMAAEAGTNALSGGDGADSLEGGTGLDTVNGNMGSDTVHGGGGNDVVFGGKGNDSVYGDGGDDSHVNGNLGDDNVFGGAGSDLVYGGQGRDTVSGDQGDDWVSGDLGDDILFGGPGADRFQFRAGSGIDWVGDFNPAEGDRIQLAPGNPYTATSYEGQVMISLGAGGEGVGLAGVGFSAFSADWVTYS